MERLLTNATPARRERLHGRDYLVAPATLIVPGVLTGSQGALFYPPDEVANDPQAWNGVPLLHYHPTRNGVSVSGRDPEILGSQQLGTVYRARAKPGGPLRAEAWFDVELTRKVDPTLLGRLLGGRPVELSTGLWTENVPAPAGSHYRGRPYTHVARNYRPDHLAVLPDQVGACSLQDGCGILVNAAAPGLVNNASATGEWLPLVTQTFCPTGAGGGINPSCGAKGKGGGKGGRPQTDKERFQETSRRTDRKVGAKGDEERFQETSRRTDRKARKEVVREAARGHKVGEVFVHPEFGKVRVTADGIEPVRNVEGWFPFALTL